MNYVEYYRIRRKRAYEMREKKSARKIKSKKDKEFFLRFAYGRNNKLRVNVRICTKEYAYGKDSWQRY